MLQVVSNPDFLEFKNEDMSTDTSFKRKLKNTPPKIFGSSGFVAVAIYGGIAAAAAGAAMLLLRGNFNLAIPVTLLVGGAVLGVGGTKLWMISKERKEAHKEIEDILNDTSILNDKYELINAMHAFKRSSYSLIDLTDKELAAYDVIQTKINELLIESLKTPVGEIKQKHSTLSGAATEIIAVVKLYDLAYGTTRAKFDLNSEQRDIGLITALAGYRNEARNIKTITSVTGKEKFVLDQSKVDSALKLSLKHLENPKSSNRDVMMMFHIHENASDEAKEQVIDKIDRLFVASAANLDKAGDKPTSRDTLLAHKLSGIASPRAKDEVANYINYIARAVPNNDKGIAAAQQANENISEMDVTEYIQDTLFEDSVRDDLRATMNGASVSQATGLIFERLKLYDVASEEAKYKIGRSKVLSDNLRAYRSEARKLERLASLV